jgi:chromosome segregation protein
MLLNRLEVKGFKSFGDKVVISFNEGITGIVGPNGCGKSNVVDAIRWVLGEQRTKNLRSDKMENVIFNGTKNRRAAQLAEVSLTFVNNRGLLPTEYSEVTISRRYFRTGESEYLLNGITCRLKDINNLFLDTGIGPDSYAIIELKMVDNLLNDTDHSRRELFEEAAGISKFKLRKKETLKKLGEADADLARVDDLLFEIDKNLKSLERQARQAERYFKTKEEYKTVSLELAKKIVHRQGDSFARLSDQATAEADHKQALAEQVEQHEADLASCRERIGRLETELAQAQMQLNEQVGKIRQYENDKKLKNERLRYLDDRQAALDKQLAEERQTAELTENRLRILEQERAGAQHQWAEAEQHLAELQAAHDDQKATVQALQQQATDQANALRLAREQLFQLNKSLEIKQIQYAGLRQELERSRNDASGQTSSLARLADELADLRDQLADQEDAVQQLKAQEADLQKKLAEAQLAADQLREELALLHRRTDALQAEYQLTKSLVDSMEGFPEAVKFLREAPLFAHGTPLLSDLVACGDEYKIAIENFLQPYMGHYVVQHVGQALEAVDLLSEAGKGKANFFVLASFATVGPAPARPAPLAGSIPALAVVEHDQKYAPLVHHLLGAVQIWPGDPHQLPDDPAHTYITQDGKVIRQAHAISGGSVGLFEGKRIGRAKNLEKLSRQLADYADQLFGLEARQKAHLADVASLRAASYQRRIEQAQADLGKLQQEVTAARLKQEQMVDLMNRHALRTEDIEGRMADLQDEMADLEPQAQAATRALAGTEAELADTNAALVAQGEVLSQRSAAYNEFNIKFFQLKNRVDTLAREAEYKQNDLQNSRRRSAQASDERQQLAAEAQQMLANLEAGDDLLLAMYDQKTALEAQATAAEQAYYAARGEADELEKQLREVRRRQEVAATLLMDLQAKLNDAKLQMASVKERLSVEFEIDLEAVMAKGELVLSDLPEDELREEQKRAKDRLEKIGAINPMAMEAYREIEERFNFINAQKEDLVKAKATLLQTVSEIDAVARENFMQAFGQIRDHFIRVFRSLFSEEDSCDLLLVDPDRPLDSDIDIVAKPKGKRPLTINQLSGGEKTLTATALLFSIYLLRPAPFCIFDEVDAPLDDANIDKFNGIIRKFSDNSQFIIVTHNKRTMAATDIIYGVTMIEQGVSRVVPVDLRELVEG